MQIEFEDYAELPKALVGRCVRLGLTDYYRIVDDPEYDAWWRENSLIQPQYVRVFLQFDVGRRSGYRLDFHDAETAALFRIRWM